MGAARGNAFMANVLGLDVGGANLKAADDAGSAMARPFALWKHPDRLSAELRDLRRRMPPHDRIAVTMTGELCDCFANKRDGVRAIVAAAVEAADGAPLQVWTSRSTLVTAAQARADPMPAAAANWLALAHLACSLAGGEPALLLDAGSTTTDVVFLDRDGPRPRGRTDYQRLACGELVYTGLRRTPVCAVLGPAVAAEWFATMLDAYLLLGLVGEDAADTDTADRRPATRPAARARLARLRCADTDELAAAELEDLARRALAQQAAQIGAAVDQVLSDRPALRQIILSGSGEAIGRQVCAGHAVLRELPIIAMSERLGPALSESACAYAVARLAAAAGGGPS